MKRLLILFAKGFPYNFSEPFLENEYPLYKDYFDKVLIVTACKQGEPPTRQVNDPSIEIVPDYTLSKDIRSILGALPWMLTDRMFYAELKNLFRNGFTWKRLYDTLVISICANHRAMQAYRWLNHHSEYEAHTLYGYWLQIPAYAALRLRGRLGDHNVRTISRCHGFDIYSERKKTGYIPFHEQSVRQLDYIASASCDGAQYLRNKYGEFSKLHTWYLGARDVGKRNPYVTRTPLQLVSCARVVPIKRLERIVDALALVDNIYIKWTHIGGGDGLNALTSYAKTKLSDRDNIVFSFTGTLPNQQIYEKYQDVPFHAFVSVSSSEGGAPISICEALGFGIPVIATAVGGQPEAVVDGVNGYLLDKDYKDFELVYRILEIANMPESDYFAMRSNARQIFEQKFNAVKNNRRFIENVLLQDLADMSKEL